MLAVGKIECAYKRATFRQMVHIGNVRADGLPEGTHRVKLTCTKLSEAEVFKPFFVDVSFAEGLYRCTYGGLVDADRDRVSKAQENAEKIVTHLQSLYPAEVKADALANAVSLPRNSRAFRDAVNQVIGTQIERSGLASATRYRFLSKAPSLPEADLDGHLS